MMRKVVLILVIVVVGAVAGWYWWGRTPSIRTPATAEPPEGNVWFEDVARRVGIDFEQFDPATETNQIPETMGSGVGWIDYDADGWLDLICVQAAPLPPRAPDPQRTHQLFRNNRDGTFTNVTAAVGLGPAGFGTGVAVGDYDNDGFDDLVICHLLGEVRLLHNVPAADGSRRFEVVTEAAKLANTNPHWAHAPAWGDFDGDGWLDLYVANYVEFDPKDPLICTHEKGLTFQCSPTSFRQPHHKLYRNNRDGSFTDISVAAGIATGRQAPGLAVAVVDFDGDGRHDIYVANDLHPAYLFHNQTEPGGPIKFTEKAEFSGCAFGHGGVLIAGMNAEVFDLDGSGRPSILVTNYQSSPNIVFQNRGQLRFVDAGMPTGLGPAGMSRLSFGGVFLDANLDGRQDAVILNGHVQRYAKELYGFSYAQEAQLFLREAGNKFREVTATAGADFRQPFVGRSVAHCDYDHDGRPDLATSGIGAFTKLWKNRIQTANHWISLELVGDGKRCNRNAIGAVVKAEWDGGTETRFIIGGGAYLAASDRRLHFGTGSANKLNRVKVTWPNGEQQEYGNLEGDRFYRLRQGNAQAEDFTPAKK